MDLRNRTMLLCGALALAIAASILLRGRRREVHMLFAWVAADMGLWYLAQSLYGLFQGSIWARVTAVLAILLPQFTLHFFEAIVPRPERTNSALLRFASGLAVPMLLLTLSPQHSSGIVRVDDLRLRVRAAWRRGCGLSPFAAKERLARHQAPA